MVSDSDFGPHESWCDTQNSISERCNCIASTYIEKIDDLRAALKVAREALEFIERDLDQVGVTPTEICHMEKCRQALAKIKTITGETK